MPTAGIVVEYNPVHSGHLHHMEETRARLGGEAALICVMSGNFVQRGDAALLRKEARAEMALRCGADLVLELPLPYALSSAEGFARGAVALLHATGVADVLSFGSEEGALDRLMAAAACIDGSGYPSALKAELCAGVSFAAARQRAVAALIGEDAASVLERPNNILAVEYLRALRRTGAAMTPLTVPREGAGHDAPSAPGQCPSARALREVLLRGEDPPGGWMPEAARAIWDRERADGRAPATLKTGERALLALLRALPEDAFAALPDAAEGLNHRLLRAARAGGSWEEITALAGTKRYAAARIRRMLLAACLGIRREDIPAQPPYLRVLGAGARGRALLARMRNAAALPVLTKPAHIRRLDATARRLFALEARAADLYGLCLPALGQGGDAWRSGPVML